MEDLVEEVKQGNKEAYTKLILLVQNDLYKHARSRLQNEHDVQDAIQEAVINAYLNINSLRKNSSFKSWIIKILTNECNKIYRNSDTSSEPFDNCANSDNVLDYINDTINFDEIIKCLNEKEKRIFKLHYEDRLTIKQISKRLNINENTIKTNLRRGKDKIKKSYKPTSLFIFILCIFIATSVIATCIISYIKNLFEVNSIGAENEGVLTAIEHLDWFQETNMDYIDLGDGYKIKMDYLLMDEMNLYLTFDLESEKDISKFTDLSFPDLKIVNENGDVICDESNIFSEHYSKKTSFKFIENTGNNIKALVYMYTDSFPVSNTLNISFSRIMFSKKSILSDNKYQNIDTNVNFKISISEKFINRNYTTYTSESNVIDKAIITETGFYSIIKPSNSKRINKVDLIDENGTSHHCYFYTLSYFENFDTFEYIVIANFDNIDSEKLKIIIDDNEYELTKNNYR